MFGRIKKTIRATWDCIRYPFLWPRNRFSGLHYTNWKLLDWINDRKAESSMYLHLSLKDTELPGGHNYNLGDGRTLSLEVHGKEVWVVLGKSGSHWERVVLKLEAPGNILDATWGEGKGEILVQLSQLPEGSRFISGRVIHKPVLYWWARFIDFIHAGPLQLLHCIPEYSELDALDRGWKKAFGEDLCRDLRKALWKEGGIKAIFKFRITQIKEKWGYLHFYYSWGGEEVDKVIRKYEDLSSKTCITCGEPATWMSRGWICPYCDSHIDNKDWADPIEDKKEEGD